MENGTFKPNFNIFALKKKRMRHIKNIFGLPLVCIGVLTMVTPFMAGHSNNNVANMAGIAMISTGIIIYVRTIKKESEY